MTQNKPTSERSGAKDPVSKVQSSTPSGPGFGKIEGTGGKSPSTPAAGGIKYFSDSGKGPFGSQKEADESAPRKQRNISAERTARNEYNAKPGQTVANRLSEVKQSDPEHGAYGGVVTDTPFDAPEDYEEDREDVHGKEFDHNHQQKTPKDFCVPQAKDTKKEGAAVSTGATTTGTPGAYNPKYDPDEDGYKEKAIVNKSNTRYGPRQVTKEEADAYLNK
jgi:hypothetical protein